MGEFQNTKELPHYTGGQGEPDYAEHCRRSSSKKVIDGPISFSVDPADATKTIDPLNLAVGGASASLTLIRNKAYRVISTVAYYFRMTAGASTALATDIYVPAFAPLVISSDVFGTFSVITDGGDGSLQAVQVD